MPTFTPEQVSEHKTVDDCWVIISGNVYNVTDWLSEHPGGPAALSKPGRGGADVTSHFNRIGHSPAAHVHLQALCIGTICADITETAHDSEQRLLSPTHLGHGASDGRGDGVRGDDEEEDEEAWAVQWHAKRRSSIIQAHPEVEQLFGTNPWTMVIGIIVCFVHASTCLFVIALNSFVVTILLAVSIGAVSKMYQFAVAHEICHGVVFEGLRREQRPLLHDAVMHLLTLPSVGVEIFEYYCYLHIGHHGSLGRKPRTVDEIYVLDDELKNTALSSGEHANGLCNDLSNADNSRGRVQIGRRNAWREMPAISDLDGDMASPVTTLLMMNKAFATAGSFQKTTFSVNNSTLYRYVLVPIYQIAHMGTLVLLQLSMAVVFNPIVWLLLFPVRTLLPGSKHVQWFYAALVRLGIFRDGDIGVMAALRVMDREYTRVAMGIGLQFWMSGIFNWLLLFRIHTETETATVTSNDPQTHQSWSAIVNGFLYLVLSELFLHGFLYHPYFGFFASVHSSPSSDSGTSSCQPTMSTYGTLTSLSCLNLNLHVEHHDFPQIPWHRLHQVRRLAPEYYDDLRQSSSFLSTLGGWLTRGETWRYACQ